ncbi:hypothetical protein AB3N59_11030 [Leptospira sp. WS92.C1]
MLKRITEETLRNLPKIKKAHVLILFSEDQPLTLDTPPIRVSVILGFFPNTQPLSQDEIRNIVDLHFCSSSNREKTKHFCCKY